MIKHWQNIARVALSWLGLFFLTRLIFLIWNFSDLNHGLGWKWLGAFADGALVDLSVLIYALIPLAIGPLLLTRYYRRIFLSIFFATVGASFLLMVFEIIFWNEFQARFNFIAIDYLIYTNEVLRNIWESYPVVPIICGLLSLALFITWYYTKHILILENKLFATRRLRLCCGLGWILAVVFNATFFPADLESGLGDYRIQEVAKNGLESLFTAYFRNELDYERFYLSEDRRIVFQRLREILKKESSQMNQDPFDLGRLVVEKGQFESLNVILVSMESMSARFMNSFGNSEHLTPNLDRLAKEGLLFSNILATGTRTVRGLEALMLSVPPIPGQSIVRRSKNEDLYNLGDYFLHAGYEAAFLYGGYSYFDNMKNFFKLNEMEVWDRSNLQKTEITFSNVWGVCDEDLYALALRRADDMYARAKPFFQVVMTTSNHRPYTYPQKIDIASGKGRSGAVKYADYAIGTFIEQAKQKPWFKNTLFVFVADHNASVAGNIEVPVRDYRIPFIVYSPGRIKPQVVSKLGSQIDVGPTLLGLLKASYKSHLYGHNLLDVVEERAFVSTYQTVGLLKSNTLTLLSPNRKVQQFTLNGKDEALPLAEKNQDLIDEAVAYYQTASDLFTHGHMRDVGDDHVIGFSSHED